MYFPLRGMSVMFVEHSLHMYYVYYKYCVPFNGMRSIIVPPTEAKLLFITVV